MSNTREGFPFYGKRDEAESVVRDLFFAPPLSRVPDALTGGLTAHWVLDYDAIITRLEEIARRGKDEDVKRFFGGREEGM